MADDKVILRTNGFPFATRRAAELRASALAKEGKSYQAIPWEHVDEDGKTHEGFALERADGIRRPQRIPVGQRNRLSAPKRPGYKRRWVNNDPGRIDMFKQAGYAVVTDQTYDPANPGTVKVGDRTDGSAPLGSVVTEEVGGGKQAVLMEIRKDWYDEDQAAKQRKIDQMEAQIKRRPKKDGFYGDIETGFDGRDPRTSSAPASAVDMDQGHFDT